MKWRKASERLPDGHKKVYIRYQGDAFIGHKNYSEEDPKMVFQSITKTFFTNDCEWLDESPVEAAEEVGTAAVNYVTEKHHKQAGENWYEEDEAEKQSFIAGATFGMGLKEKEIERLKGLLESVIKKHRFYCPHLSAEKAWNQFCKQNNIEP